MLETSWDQCRNMVQYSFTSTETIRLVRTDSPGRPPRLSNSSWTMLRVASPSRDRYQTFAWWENLLSFPTFIVISFDSFKLLSRSVFSSEHFENDSMLTLFSFSFSSWCYLPTTRYWNGKQTPTYTNRHTHARKRQTTLQARSLQAVWVCFVMPLAVYATSVTIHTYILLSAQTSVSVYKIYVSFKHHYPYVFQNY